jgi:hypothetical protein
MSPCPDSDGVLRGRKKFAMCQEGTFLVLRSPPASIFSSLEIVRTIKLGRSRTAVNRWRATRIQFVCLSQLQ